MEGEALPMLLEAITGVLQSADIQNKEDDNDTIPNVQLTDSNVLDELSRKISANGVEMLKDKFPNKFKFIVQSLLIPKLSGEVSTVGLSMSTAAVWEPSKDLTFNVRWENKDVQCIVSVVAIAI